MLSLSVPAAHAQPDIFGPQRSAWGPRLDTFGISAATRVLWRAHDIGTGAHAAAVLGIYGRSVTASGTWHVSATADAIAVDADGSRVDAALEAGRLLGESGAVIGAWAGAYLLHENDAGAELGVRIDAIPIPWLPEVRPTVHLRASRATGPLDGTFLAAWIRQDVGIRQYALRLEIGADTDDAARAHFAAPRWRTEAGIAKGIGQWLLHVDAGAVRTAGATLGWGGAGASWRY